MTQHEMPIDLQWEPFKFKMDSFLLALDSYTEAMKGRLAAASHQHADKVKDFDVNKAQLEDLIKAEKEKETRMCAALEAERQAIQEKTQMLSALGAHLDKQKAQTAEAESIHTVLLRDIAAIQETKSKQSRILQDHMNKDDRDLSRIIDLLGVEMTRDGKHFMCTYTKIDPNAPEKEYKIILLEEEGNNRFSVARMLPHIGGINTLAAKAQEERGHDRSMMLWFLNQVRLMFKSTVQEDDLNSMFGSLTTRPTSAKSSSTG